VSRVLSSRRGLLALAALLTALVVLALAVLASGGGSDEVVVYNGRSQYGDEEVFRQFERERDVTLELRGGTAPELFTRLRSEGDQTPADLLVTTDLANLWRAQEACSNRPGAPPWTLRSPAPTGLRTARGGA
jgi:iron(III) transport system substrate-binding protein